MDIMPGNTPNRVVRSLSDHTSVSDSEEQRASAEQHSPRITSTASTVLLSTPEAENTPPSNLKARLLLKRTISELRGNAKTSSEKDTDESHPAKRRKISSLRDKNNKLNPRRLHERIPLKSSASACLDNPEPKSVQKINAQRALFVQSPSAASSGLTAKGWMDEIEAEQEVRDKNNDPLAFLKPGYWQTKITTKSEHDLALEQIELHPEIRLSTEDLGKIMFCKKSKIGEGVNSTIYTLPNIAQYKDKVLKLSRDRQFSKDQLINEAAHLCQLSHPNLIKLTGCCVAPSFTCLILEKKQKSLSSYVRENNIVPLDKRKKIMCDMASGLDYLHSKDIIHRDAHLANFLIDYDGTVTITDLGMAAHLSMEKRLFEEPPMFNSAPELTYRENEIQSKKSDVFSLGFSMLSVLTWKRHYMAWYTPELDKHETTKKHEIHTGEPSRFCRYINPWKKAHPGVQKFKWVTHEVLPDYLFLRSKDGVDKQKVLVLIKSAMAYNPEERTDTQTILKTLKEPAETAVPENK